MRLKVETITPSKAKKWLEEHNTKNRPISVSHVAFLRKMIRNDEWEEENGDTIKFHKDGWLIDGQHRLQAIVETGRSLRCAVARDINGRAFDTVDTGRPRHLKDMLARDGEMYSTHLATAIRYVHVFSSKTEAPTSLLKTKLTIQEGYSILDKSTGLRTSLKTMFAWGAPKLGSCGLLTGAYQACRGLSKDWAEEFWEAVVTGVGLEDTEEPAYKLRDRLLTNKAAMPHERLDRVNTVALIIKAWNCYAQGRVMTNCRITGNDAKAHLMEVEE